MVELGTCDVVLQREHVRLVPKRFPLSSRGAELQFAYADIASVSILKKADEEKRSRFVVRLHDGTEIASSFPRKATLRMRALCHQATKRVRAASNEPRVMPQ